MPHRPSGRPRGSAPLSGSPDLPGEEGALCAKLRALVRRHERSATLTSSVMLLAVAALRASATALATIRAGRCAVRNDLWVRLAQGRRRRWRLLGPGEASTGEEEEATLEELATSRALRLREERVPCVVRYERDDAAVAVELRVERVRGRPPVALATITDVTGQVHTAREVARMREALDTQERLRAVGELASGVAHDLNNTLHALRLRLSRLGACAGACAEHRDDLRVLERIASDAGARVRRFQDLARRRVDVPREPVDLRAIVDDAVAIAQAGAGDPGRRAAVEVALPPLPPVLGDRADLAHVLVNLFLNARDAMPAGGRATVSGHVTPRGGVELTVADEGHGIPPDNLARVFDPFFTTKGRRGTGLGLSTAAAVMRRLGGGIRAANRPGGGAAFTLTFPRAEGAVPPPRDAGPARSAPSQRVLVVDDDPDNLDAMRLVLAQRGQRVDTTPSGLDAVARVEGGERYDTVVCDLGLGDLGGWDVAERIGTVSPATRILLLTGWAQEIAPGDPRRRHVERVLAKPLEAQDLEDIVRGAPRAPPGPASPPPGPASPPIGEASPG